MANKIDGSGGLSGASSVPPGGDDGKKQPRPFQSRATRAALRTMESRAKTGNFGAGGLSDPTASEDITQRAVQSVHERATTPEPEASNIRSPDLRAMNHRLQNLILKGRMDWLTQTSGLLTAVGEQSSKPEEAQQYADRAKSFIDQARGLQRQVYANQQADQVSVDPNGPFDPTYSLVSWPGGLQSQSVHVSDDLSVMGTVSGEELTEALEDAEQADEELGSIDQALGELEHRLDRLQMRLAEASSEEGTEGTRSFGSRIVEFLNNLWQSLREAILALGRFVRRGAQAAAECFRRCCCCSSSSEDEASADHVVVDFNQGSFEFSDEAAAKKRQLEAAFTKFMRRGGGELLQDSDGNLRIPRATMLSVEEMAANDPEFDPLIGAGRLLDRMRELNQSVRTLSQHLNDPNTAGFLIESMDMTLEELNDAFSHKPRRNSIG